MLIGEILLSPWSICDATEMLEAGHIKRRFDISWVGLGGKDGKLGQFRLSKEDLLSTIEVVRVGNEGESYCDTQDLFSKSRLEPNDDPRNVGGLEIVSP